MIRRRTHLVLRTKFAARTFLPMTIACAALSGCALTKQISPNTYQSSRSAESRKLHEIFESFFEAELVALSHFRHGNRRPSLRRSAGNRHQRRAYCRATPPISAHAPNVRPKSNSTRSMRATRLYLEVFTRNLQLALDGFGFEQQLMPVRQLASLAVEFPLLGSGAGAHPFRTVTDYENFLKRIDGFEALDRHGDRQYAPRHRGRIIQPRSSSKERCRNLRR